MVISPSPSFRRGVRGFSLLEILVAVAIIGVLAVLLLPSLKKMTASAQQAQCANNLRQIGVMTRNYLNDNQNTFPQMWTWLTELADYAPEVTSAFHCPTDKMDRPGVAKSRWRSYAINPLIHNFLGQCPAFPGAKVNDPVNINMIRRPSHVYYLTENFQVDANIYSMDNVFGSISGNPGNDGKHHGKRTNLLLMDGHVESIVYNNWSDFANSYLFNN